MSRNKAANRQIPETIQQKFLFFNAFRTSVHQLTFDGDTDMYSRSPVRGFRRTNEPTAVR